MQDIDPKPCQTLDIKGKKCGVGLVVCSKCGQEGCLEFESVCKNGILRKKCTDPNTIEADTLCAEGVCKKCGNKGFDPA